MRRRWLWSIVLLLVSVAITVVGTLVFHNPFLALFLFLPLGPWVFGGRRDSSPLVAGGRCPTCGFTSAESWVEYCPRDGTPLMRGA